MSQENNTTLTSAFASRFKRSIPGRDVSASVSQMRTQLAAWIAAQGTTSEQIDLIPIDGDAGPQKLRFSVLVVTYRDKNDTATNRVAYHTLILAGSAPDLEPRYDNIMPGSNQKTEITLVPGDAYDSIMIGAIEKQVLATYTNNPTLVFADARVVPRDFDMMDQAAIATLGSSVWATVAVAYQTDEGGADIVLSDARQDPSQYTIRTNFGRVDKIDSVGEPVRTDFQISMQSVASRSQSMSTSLNGESSSVLTQVGGFIDLVQTSQLQYNQYGAQAPAPGQGPIPYAKFAPNVVITTLDSAKNPATLVTNMLSLFTSFSLTEPRAVYPYFNQTHQSGAEINLRDIGMLNLKTNMGGNPGGVGQPLITTANEFTVQNLAQYLDAVFEPYVYVSIDVPECGEGTCVNGPFAAAASTNPKLAANGNKELTFAADWLTDGAFSRHFPQGSVWAVQKNDRIPLGHYIDSNGLKQDIRNIDYLAVLNRTGHTGLQKADDYAMTFTNMNLPLAQRLSMRIALLRELQPSLVVTGYAQRVTVTPAAIQALIASVTDANLNVINVGAYGNALIPDAPIYANLASYGMPVQQNSVFNRSNGGGMGGVAQGRMGRW